MLLTVACCNLLPLKAIAQVKNATPYVVDFPNDHSLGQVYILDPDWNPNAWPAKSKLCVDAKGRVKFPADKRVSFCPNGRLVSHSEVLSGEFARHLDVLILNYLEIDDKLLKTIGSCTNLRRLDLNETDITDGQLDYLKPLVKLRDISLAKTLIKGPGLKNFWTMKELKALNLGGCDLDPGCLAWLPETSKMERLMLTHAKVTDKDMAIFGKLPLLFQLQINENNGITDSGIKYLSNLRAMQILNVEETMVTARGLTALNLPSLGAINLPERCDNKRDLAMLKTKFPHATLMPRNKSRENSSLTAPKL